MRVGSDRAAPGTGSRWIAEHAAAKVAVAIGSTTPVKERRRVSAVPGVRMVLLSGGLAAQGSGRGPGPGHAPGAAGDGVCRACRAAADHRPLHLDPVSGRVRDLRPVEDPRARAGLVARADDRRHDPSSAGRERRPEACGRARLDACADRGGDHGARWSRQARIRRRPALEADHDRVHERTRADDPRRSAAEAVRVLGRRRRLHPRAEGVRQGSRPRRDGAGRARGRRVRPRADRRAAAGAAEGSGGPGRRWSSRSWRRTCSTSSCME